MVELKHEINPGNSLYTNQQKFINSSPLLTSRTITRVYTGVTKKLPSHF